jgi:hypothetical protein
VTGLLEERRALLSRAGETAVDCAHALSDGQCGLLANAVSDSASLTSPGSAGKGEASTSSLLLLDDPASQLLVFRTLHLAGRLRDNASLLVDAAGRLATGPA